MAPAAAAAALVRLPLRPARATLPNQGFGRRRSGASSLAVRAKDSDDLRVLISEKPAEPAEPAPAKREGWEGFGREVGDGDGEVQMQGESASWNVLNQIGVGLDSENSYTALVYGTSALVTIWISSIVVSALDSVPLVPQVMEVVGLGFTVWFTSRYLIFKENRDELIARIGSIKKQILGSRGD
uniref:Cyanobacterial aminoacyl-tRNA synthetase CAAD domain-containing protein n=1 Tax=Oryza meridionalis TaxID=40149 RepID=A0A0E0ET17_9ORYZ